jgi:small-conductance mechanosensitive channel
MNKIGIACVAIALFLELGSYWKQIAKTLRDRNSDHVSSSAYMLKIAKYVFTLIGLSIYSNWVGFGLEVAALAICLAAFYVIVRFKPKGWKPW